VPEIGQTVSHYTIIEKLGAGGMGEVYRAEDTNLNRQVAIKVLPDIFASDPERLARFEREAKLLASLNHPNIASIYGLEEADGKRFLVLELVEGQTLAERLHKGPLPVEEALEVCRQIAEGLEAAHEKGIIHRDLKPANVKVTPEGKVKVLDFGLARALHDQASKADQTHSPTITDEMTRPGVVLGTAAYMSPEQAKGKAVDKRADIWAFGCVLYECLTGKRTFQGDTITETVAAILKSEPDWTLLPADTPSSVRAVLRRCLQKDPSLRLRDIGDARLEIESVAEGRPDPGQAVAGGRGNWVRALPWAIVGLLGIVTVVALVFQGRPAPPAPRPASRLTIHLPTNQRLARTHAVPFAISRDGQQVAYVAQEGSRSQLYLRRLDSFDAVPVPGTDRAATPFFSPDGKWLGFFADRRLRKVAVAGGTPVDIAEAPLGFGATWGSGDTIIFTASLSSGLKQVSASGGEVTSLTRPDFKQAGYSHNYPQLLPDGSGVLFTIWGLADGAAVLSLKTREWHRIVPGVGGAQYLDSGHLVYLDNQDQSRLVAAPFNLSRKEVTGPSIPVLQGVDTISMTTRASFATSPNGTLVYAQGSGASRMLGWVVGGQPKALGADPGDYLGPRISPSGDRIAVHYGGNLWILYTQRPTRARLTYNPTANDAAPVWSPDGSEVAFSSNRTGIWSVYLIPADSTGQGQPLHAGDHDEFPTSWSRDGRFLLFTQIHPDTGADIWILPRNGKPEPLVKSPCNEHSAQFSPNGRWVAFASDETGKDEVYVQPFPATGKKWPLSADGGTTPVWSRDGRKIFYHNGDDMMVVSFEDGLAPRTSVPRRLFSGAYEWCDFERHYFGASYDVAADGATFVMTERSPDLPAGELRVVLNWFEELKRLVRGGKKQEQGSQSQGSAGSPAPLST
jgi:Tol biopolymer transport system component